MTTLREMANLSIYSGYPNQCSSSVTLTKIASFLSQPFTTLTSSLCEKKNAVYSNQISLFVPEIFKFLKYASQKHYGNKALRQCLLNKA